MDTSEQIAKISESYLGCLVTFLAIVPIVEGIFQTSLRFNGDGGTLLMMVSGTGGNSALFSFLPRHYIK